MNKIDSTSVLKMFLEFVCHVHDGLHVRGDTLSTHNCHIASLSLLSFMNESFTYRIK